MKARVKILFFFFIVSCIIFDNSILAQNKQTYTQNGTTYIYGETYSTTGKPKVERSSSAKTQFLKSKGLKKIPSGYQIDHIKPLSEGGADVPSNMQLIPISQHRRKTASERASNSTSSTYKAPKYKSTSTYKSSTNSYSKPSYSSSSSRTIQTGPKGGQYYINKNGNKTYVKKK